MGAMNFEEIVEEKTTLHGTLAISSFQVLYLFQNNVLERMKMTTKANMLYVMSRSCDCTVLPGGLAGVSFFLWCYWVKIVRCILNVNSYPRSALGYIRTSHPYHTLLRCKCFQDDAVLLWIYGFKECMQFGLVATGFSHSHDMLFGYAIKLVMID